MASDPEQRLQMARRILGHRLRDARLEAELTLPVAAERAGVAAGYLSDCERGNKLPSLMTLVDIAAAYEVLVVDLLAGLYPFGSHTAPSAVPPPPPDGRARPNV